MLALEPIAESIQKRMFEKMRVLGRQESTKIGEIISDNSLKHEDIATRTTFIRMTSGAHNAVVMMGGLLKEDGSMIAGYDDIYGSRTYKERGKERTQKVTEQLTGISGEHGSAGYRTVSEGTGIFDANKITVGNLHKRPMPGVKSIDVSFKGGLRTLREATISWTCWSWEDLNSLMSHFLAHGKTVMVEWGWVYNKETLGNLPNFWKPTDAAGNKSIDASAFTDYKNIVLSAKGDFDMMVGIIKNFEFTTRDDGGFDCQTILSSVGVSLFEDEQPSSNVLAETIKYKISKREKDTDIRDKLKSMVEDKDDSELINFDISVSLKSFLANFHNWIVDDWKSNLKKRHVGRKKVLTPVNELRDEAHGGKVKYSEPYRSLGDGQWEYKYVYKQNAYIADVKVMDGTGSDPPVMEIQEDVWVRWGWFEDNILSKFLTLVSDSPDVPLVTQFRSVEKITNPSGEETPFYESTRIKNSPQLETIDINSYILPSQFHPLSKVLLNNQDPLEGDEKFMLKLESIVNDKDSFEPFTAVDGFTLREIINDDKLRKTVINTLGDVIPFKGTNDEYEMAIQDDFIDGWTYKFKKKYDMKYFKEHALTETKKMPDTSKKYGYLRNMLINLKVIKQAFGLTVPSGLMGSTLPLTEWDFSADPIDLKGSIEAIFVLLNQNMPLWDFQIVTDEIEDWRAKIIDNQITKLDFDRAKEIGFQKLKSNKIAPKGIFYFPVWQSDSLVKKQNVTAKVPNALALTTMYGANFDTVSTFGASPPEVVGTEAFILGKMFEDFDDVHKKNIDIAFRKDGAETIGTIPNVDNTMALTKDGGTVNLKTWMLENMKKEKLSKSFKDKLTAINKNLEASSAIEPVDFDSSISLALPDDILKSPNGVKLLSDMLSVPVAARGTPQFEHYNNVKKNLHALYTSKFNANGRMRAHFISSVNYLIGELSITRNIERRLLIPLEMELTIDGIGGIYPGNSFNSTYLPARYQKETVFQAFNVNHRVDDSGWTVTLTGKMRSNLLMVSQEYREIEELYKDQIKNWKGFKIQEVNKAKEKSETKQTALAKLMAKSG